MVYKKKDIDEIFAWELEELGLQDFEEGEI
jgi:hypothetical protein